MAGYTLVNEVSVAPLNCNVGYNNSWLNVKGNTNRALFAQASYITNFDDFSVSLSAGNLNIGSVELKDGNSNLKADVVDAGSGLNALRVISQDLESTVDDITIGDKNKNYASVVPHLSALQVNVTNLNDSANVDAFGRLRVSQPYTLFDSKSLYDKERYFWNSVGSNGAEIFNTNDSSRTSYVTANNAFFIKETYRRFGYQPGKSQLCMFTGILSAELNILKRVGLFQSLSSNNYSDEMSGIYFQSLSTTFTNPNQTQAWVVNNDGFLVPSQSAVQADWNIDKFDGTGPSKITLDFSKSQIFVIDFEWLGVGRVRCGFNIDGITHYAHYFNHANHINGVYTKTPNLPLRAEIRSVGATYGSMKTICASIQSEGGEDPAFVTRSISTSGTMLPAQDQRKGILGIRLNPNRTNGINEIIDISTVCDAGSNASTAPYRVELIFRPTPVQGVTWVDFNASSNMQYALTPSAGVDLTGGHIAVTEYAANTSTVNLNKPQYSKTLKLGRNLQGVPDECWLVITSLTNKTAGLWGSITVAESD